MAVFTRARAVAGVALLALVAGAALASPDAALARLTWLASDPIRFGVALVGLALLRPFVAWPTTVLAVAVGYGYGAGLWGVPLALALIVVTSVPPFLAARRFRGDGRLATAGERVVSATGDVRSVAASRLLPLPSDVVSVGVGVAGVSTWAFVVGTAVGEVPWAVAGVFAGAAATSLSAGTLSGLFDVRLVVTAAAGGVGLLAGPAYRAWRGGLLE